MKNNPLPRLDNNRELRNQLLPFCRLKHGDIWHDPECRHRIACRDAADTTEIVDLVGRESPTLAIHDPPYNLIAFDLRSVEEFIHWCRQWVRNTTKILAPHASLYIWLGADQNDGFQPLPDFMLMMRDEPYKARSFITMRNQRGYGTQKNWMAIRQELLYYTKGSPIFNVDAEYTDIPKILRGYYKVVNGKKTENLERSNSDNIRAGNVWVDIQQVFYRMDENVSGCYAQKPLKCIERIIGASSLVNDVVVDFFAHSGATLLAAEKLGRRCITADVDPIYAEICIRRLERFRKTGHEGWQNGHPFEDEVPSFADSPIGDASEDASRMPQKLLF
ncbi:MAG: site-specific DNA-methyltransferase [Planctomycetota bacterium]|nr:site-specific DNA-methyltransferase [Planctomycetota bacterium]